MNQSTYDSCLLYKLTSSFDIVNMQIDDTLILAEQSFADAEENAIVFVEIMIKARDHLQVNKSLKFNDIIITLNTNNNISVQHLIIIELIKNSSSITINSRDIVRLSLFFREQYVTQRARDVYLVFVYQLEASFDLSHVAQTVESTSKDISGLNKRLQ
jgi:hypothetical protein